MVMKRLVLLRVMSHVIQLLKMLHPRRYIDCAESEFTKGQQGSLNGLLGLINK